MSVSSLPPFKAIPASGVTPSLLLRWSGVSAMLAGFIFAAIQPIHPPDTVASVTTTFWTIITLAKTVMCLLLLAGITGIYFRQLRYVGVLGLFGYLMFSLGWVITTGNVLTETFILPPLAAIAPDFVDGLLGVAAGRSSPVNLGLIPVVFMLSGVFYMLGGVLLGVATFRSGLFPRWAGALMALTAGLTPLAALLPHAVQRYAAVPMGVALIGLGHALWTGRQEQVDIQRGTHFREASVEMEG